jgi:hypothetical protein
VPDDPADPQAAALELIVRLPSSLSARLADAGQVCGLTEIPARLLRRPSG